MGPPGAQVLWLSWGREAGRRLFKLLHIISRPNFPLLPKGEIIIIKTDIWVRCCCTHFHSIKAHNSPLKYRHHYPLFLGEENEAQMPKFTKPETNKARILPRQSAFLSRRVLSPQRSMGLAMAGMGFETRPHVLWSPAQNLAWPRGPLPSEGAGEHRG